MPYDIRQENGKWTLRKRDDGELMGTHDTKEEAEAQERAIYANEDKRKGHWFYR